MVIGIDKFREFFNEFSDNYIIIGGTACDIILDDSDDVEPRATTDIDMILVVEKMTPEFGRQFWRFIREGEYKNRQRKRGDGKLPIPELYRFLKPKPGYPLQIELLSIQPEILGDPVDFHLTPIPLGEELSSLSAILMNPDSYHFTIANSQLEQGLRVASPTALMILKATAYINLKKERMLNPNVRSHDIKKHGVDVFLLLSEFRRSDRIELPDLLKETMRKFIQEIEGSLPNQSLQDSLGISEAILREYILLMKEIFMLQSE